MPPPKRLSRPAPSLRWRDRFFTRQTAEAIMAPTSIVLAGAGTAVGVLADLGLASALLGLAAYAGSVLWKMPRRRARTEAIEPRRLRDPWRRYVREALDAEQRFEAAVASTASGPLHDRLHDMAGRVADAVAECWRIAKHGQQLQDALQRLDSISTLESRLARAGGNEEVAAALRGQIDTYRRIAQTTKETRQRLEVLEARLDETVARAVEVSLRAGDPVEIGALDDDVHSLVTEMEALRRGLDETAGRAVSGA